MKRFACFLLFAVAASSGVRAQTVRATLSETWTSVKLPAAPLAVAAHGGTLWVCGMDGLIARSADQGQTWQVVHRSNGGPDLTQFSFPDAHTIIASGSDAMWLESGDGGSHWSAGSRKAGPFLKAAVFTGPAAEYGAIGNRLLWTSDGGKQWQVHSFTSGGQRALSILALAARGTAQIAALAEEAAKPHEQPQQFVIASVDAGRSWHELKLRAGTTWKQLRADGHGFALYGTSSTGEPETSFSKDGLQWPAPAPAAAVYHHCQVQGCLMAGGWADMTGSSPQLWNLPPDKVQPLTVSWAAAGSTVCRASSTLRCRRGAAAWRNPAPAFLRAGRVVVPLVSWNSVVDRDTLQAFDTGTLGNPASMDTGGAAGPDNVVRQMPTTPSGRAQRLSGSAIVRVLIDRNGRVQQALLMATTSADLAGPALKKAHKLRFRPIQFDGHAQPAELQIRFYSKP